MRASVPVMFEREIVALRMISRSSVETVFATLASSCWNLAVSSSALFAKRAAD